MSRPIVPPFLKPGEAIAVVGPSGPVDRARLKAGIAYLERKGHPVVVDPSVFKRGGYLAGDDAVRAAGVNGAIRGKRVGAILFARGGYGLTRILDVLDLGGLRRRPKTLLGYSDATALFMALQRRSPYLVNYGPVVSELGRRGSFDEATFWSALYGRGPAWKIGFDRKAVVRHGRGTGLLMGGCLTLLVNLLGTPHDPDYRGSILFWEEIGEEPYRIDRMLTQLRNAGKFDALQGMIVGSVTGCTPRKGSASASVGKIIEEVAAAVSFPVVRGLKAGHVGKKITLPLGVRGVLDTKRGVLSLRPWAV